MGRAIRKGNSLINSNSSAIVHNGKKTSLWYDIWFKESPLRNVIPRPLNKEDSLIIVNQLANDLGSWSWEIVSFNLPQSIKDLINAILRFKESSLEDVSSCNFQKKWLLQTKSVVESDCHLFIECPVSKSIWHLTRCKTQLSNCNNFGKSIASAAEFHDIALSNVSTSQRNSLTLPVKWIPPMNGWWKMNCDGACEGNLRPFSIGGILRDNLGNWISGFSGFIGDGTALKAELWGITMGFPVGFSMKLSFLIPSEKEINALIN
ncbi:putative ribonuclease H protein At1g65750 family [Senna tora]|uniref:Putative ribonuclease H protein At1g65750 family n=1 Tax=Senna tora TaxID=362788 RepID=A0A834WW87_9FABA|nr:putative ribonuclease H protein At1g65750 family [Senna tora]